MHEDARGQVTAEDLLSGGDLEHNFNKEIW